MPKKRRKRLSLLRVLAAECRRVLLHKGTLTAYPIFLLVSAAVGAGLELSIRANGANTFGILDVSRVAEYSACAFAVFSCLYTMVRSGRDYADGAMQFIAAAVPKRGRLYAARAISWALPAAIGSAAVVAALFLYNMNAGIDGQFDFNIMAATVGLGALATFIVNLMAFAISTLVRKSWLAALIWLGLFALFPGVLWLAMGSGGDMQGIFESLFYSSPSIGFYSSVKMSEGNPDVIWQGLAVIAAWTVLLTAWSGISFSGDSLSRRLEKH